MGKPEGLNITLIGIGHNRIIVNRCIEWAIVKLNAVSAARLADVASGSACAVVAVLRQLSHSHHIVVSYLSIVGIARSAEADTIHLDAASRSRMYDIAESGLAIAP